MTRFGILFRFTPYVLSVLGCLAASPLYATCTNPGGKEADIIYNQVYHTYQFCNGTSWLAYGGGQSCLPSSAGYSPTTPSGNGYFVLSSSTFAISAHAGDLPGWNSQCYTELTTHTGWKGYATANSNGQLVASKIHAFLCDYQFCMNLMPLTVYYFANAADSSAGGASFMTDALGDGPNDSADWAAVNYFNAAVDYWIARATGGTSTAWGMFGWWGAGDSSTGYGTSSNTGGYRWNNSTANTGSKNIICFVDP